MGCSDSVEAVPVNETQPVNRNQTGTTSLPPKTQPVVNSTQNRWEMEALKSHNAFRARHGVGPLTIDSEISRKAQAYAQYLADNNLFEHSKDRDNLGENLYTMSSSELLTNEPLGTAATESWYDEIQEYDFNNPGFSMGTGHFTQVVWKNSRRLGVGVAFGDGGRRAVVVAQYGPPGNYMGEFPENVPPPNS